jgi:hypothetical protein
MRTSRPVVAATEPSAAGAVRAALAALSPRQGTAVILRYFLDLDVSGTPGAWSAARAPSGS